VCAVDWDGDGRLDLLVGDYTTQKPDRPEPTAAEKAEQDKLRKELETVRLRFSELIEKVHGPSRAKGKEDRDKADKEFQEVMEKMRGLQEKLPPEYESHGWVWLYRRKPAEGSGGRP
jgi:hypothetical protein